MRRLLALLWISLLIGTLATPKIVKAEETVYWAKTYGGSEDEWAFTVAVAPGGDIVVAGSTFSFGGGNDDAWVLRLDSEGNVKWQKTYGGLDGARSLALAPNGDIIVAGHTESFGAGNSDLWVLRLDSNGNIKWQKTYGGKLDDGAFGVNIALAPNGDIILAGSTDSFGLGRMAYPDVWVLRLDPKGNIKWQKTYGGRLGDSAKAIAIAPNGDVIVAGFTCSFGAGDGDFWVLRLDNKGNVKWQKTYGGNNGDWANAVAIAKNGDIIVAGHTESFGVGYDDVWVLRLDPNGNIKWQKTYGGKKDDTVDAIAVNPNGDIVIAGSTCSFGVGDCDLWVLRLDPNGNVKWQKTYGGNETDSAESIALTGAGDIIVAGSTSSFSAGDEDVWVLKLPPNGEFSKCKICSDSDAQIKYTNAKVSRTDAEVHDTNAEIHTTHAKVQDTNAQVSIQCITAQETFSTMSQTSVPNSTVTQISSKTQSKVKTKSEEPKRRICGPAFIIVLTLVPLMHIRKLR
ncbi:MAG: CGP-CTERM sorting domain-containing protein [Thermococci archaeon]|nr:CGP-CTERM sorting domain-containing protein [Thermococci archaeon]